MVRLTLFCCLATAVLAGVAAAVLPKSNVLVWAEASVVAVSAILLAIGVWWLSRRSDVPDQSLVRRLGLGVGLFLGGVWIVEIGLNNLTPPSWATAATRGVLDNAVWAFVGLATAGFAAFAASTTGRFRTGLRVGVWSGVGSGVGAALGGALLLAFFRWSVERDPLMMSEYARLGAGFDFPAYVTKETMAGVGGHLWVIGVAQGALLGAIGAALGWLLWRARKNSSVGLRTPR